jgi:YfiR/HmsC-like
LSRTRPSSVLRTFVALALLMTTAPGRAQPSEEAVKAAFIPKFARYVTWPAAAAPPPRAPYHLCVIGRDSFGPLLDRAAASELVEGHGVTVRRVATPQGAAGCHVAFVRGPVPSDTTRFLLALRNRPILTVTDARAGPQRGMIHFTVAGGRVRFFIDEAAASQHGLAISSRLLSLALGVRQRRS